MVYVCINKYQKNIELISDINMYEVWESNLIKINKIIMFKNVSITNLYRILGKI